MGPEFTRESDLITWGHTPRACGTRMVAVRRVDAGSVVTTHLPIRQLGEIFIVVYDANYLLLGYVKPFLSYEVPDGLGSRN